MTTTTMPPTVPAPSARHLLDAARCTPLCLLAVSHPRGCTCRCGGQHHGALLDAPVSDEAERNAA
ncbi:hypothetical protein [Parafrankia sp. Ea1.12]|uniref:hypothetical protein n=1 Tax=Parafrankia sp. Ea1.12 TaxID=573499 RepID=UPI00135B5B7F|nr:hypothetical protein [Parafrankia sp. Ea1.12]